MFGLPLTTVPSFVALMTRSVHDCDTGVPAGPVDFHPAFEEKVPLWICNGRPAWYVRESGYQDAAVKQILEALKTHPELRSLSVIIHRGQSEYLLPQLCFVKRLLCHLPSHITLRLLVHSTVLPETERAMQKLRMDKDLIENDSLEEVIRRWKTST